MYCSGCGQPIVPNQPVCAHCGRPSHPFSPPAVPQYASSGFPIHSRVQKHLQTLGMFWLVYSLFAVIAWFAAIPFLGFIFSHAGHHFRHQDFPLPMSLGWILPLATTFIYLRAGLGILVGIGLLRRERWARPLALIVGILSLIKFPFGTALGIYTLWVLVPAQSAMEYDAVAAP